jgi:hypothetical protein
MRSFSSKQNHLHKGEEMFDPSMGDALVMILLAAVYFHIGRIAGHRVGYLKGRKAVREYYESRDKVRV